MAEGLLRALHADRYETFSAGLRPAPVSRQAIRVMAESGIDIGNQTAKSIETFAGMKFDCIAMVCGDPKGECPFLSRHEEGNTCDGCSGCCTFHPFFPLGTRVIHAQFRNLIGAADTEEDIDLFRQTRDEIRDWIKKNFG